MVSKWFTATGRAAGRARGGILLLAELRFRHGLAGREVDDKSCLLLMAGRHIGLASGQFSDTSMLLEKSRVNTISATPDSRWPCPIWPVMQIRRTCFSLRGSVMPLSRGTILPRPALFFSLITETMMTKPVPPVPQANQSHKGPGSAPSIPLDTTKGHRDDEKNNIREQAEHGNLTQNTSNRRSG
jgi:hypothetical protein